MSRFSHQHICDLIRLEKNREKKCTEHREGKIVFKNDFSMFLDNKTGKKRGYSLFMHVNEFSWYRIEIIYQMQCIRKTLRVRYATCFNT